MIGPRHLLVSALLAVLLGLVSAPAGAQPCTVPGSHSAIQAAVDDPGCATIALSSQTYPESVEIPRTITLFGPAGGGAVVEGLIRVVGSGTQATLVDLRVENGCAPSALRSATGASVAGSNLEVVRSAALPCPPAQSLVFRDGFESGDTSAWTATMPP